MMRIPGFTCTTELGPHWIDQGTSPRTRIPSPAQRTAAPSRRAARSATARAPTPHERQVLTALDAASITDRQERAMFLAQVSHESQDFRHVRENLHYSPERLLSVFPAKFTDLADAQAVVAQGTTAIAERIYGGRLGNTHPGDGGRYFGRGYIQLTGRDNYAAAGAALGLDLVNHPELAEDRGNAARIALWYWRVNHASQPARRGDVRTVTRIVNGGTNGLADRTLRYQRYLSILAAHDAASAAPSAPQPGLVLP